MTFFIYPILSQFTKLFKIRRQIDGCIMFHKEMTIAFASQQVKSLALRILPHKSLEGK